MNKISATGRLAADAEVRFTPRGDPVASFRLASDVGFGENKSTNWFQCQIWGKRGEALAPHLTKGQQITAFGTLTLRPWKDKEGQEKISADIRIDEIEMQGSKKVDDAPQQRIKPAQTSVSSNFADMDDDIPFN